MKDDKKVRVTNRITSIAKESDRTELERLYEIIKEQSKEEGLFLGKMLEKVFDEYIKKHNLGEINEALKEKEDSNNMH